MMAKEMGLFTTLAARRDQVLSGADLAEVNDFDELFVGKPRLKVLTHLQHQAYEDFSPHHARGDSDRFC